MLTEYLCVWLLVALTLLVADLCVMNTTVPDTTAANTTALTTTVLDTFVPTTTVSTPLHAVPISDRSNRTLNRYPSSTLKHPPVARYMLPVHILYPQVPTGRRSNPPATHGLLSGSNPARTSINRHSGYAPTSTHQPHTTCNRYPSSTREYPPARRYGTQPIPSTTTPSTTNPTTTISSTTVPTATQRCCDAPAVL